MRHAGVETREAKSAKLADEYYRFSENPYEETMRSCRSCWRQIAVDHLPLMVHKHCLNSLGDTVFDLSADCVLGSLRLFVLFVWSSGRGACLRISPAKT